MRLSVVIAILNSHEVVRRQILHFSKMNLANNIEIIFVDDGSDPPLHTVDKSYKVTIYETHNKRPWTQPEARNLGVRKATGDYVVCTDIDHIIPLETLEYVANTSADVVRFKREAGVLDENGEFTQDRKVLNQYGLLPERGLSLPPHGNSYAIKRELFLELGGSKSNPEYPNRDELRLKRKLKFLHSRGKISIIEDSSKPLIYMFPNGRFCGEKDYNPFGLFHNLKR